MELFASTSSIAVRINLESGSLRNVDLSSFLCLSEHEARHFLAPLVRFHGARRPITQQTCMSAIAQLGDAFRALGFRHLPESESSWQDFVYRAFEYVLSRPDKKVRLDKRAGVWNKILASGLELLRDQEGIIPLGVEILRCTTRIDDSDLSAFKEKMLGDKPAEEVEDVAQKLLVDISLARTDAAYLDELRDILAYRRGVLENCLLEWWRQLKAHFEYGQRRIMDVNWQQLKARLDTGRYVTSGGRGKATYHIALGPGGRDFGNVLAILTHEHEGMCAKQCFSNSRRLPHLTGVRIPADAPSPVSPKITKHQRLNWMLGNLGSIDIAVCAALLIMHNPKYTPHSTLHCKVKDKHGRSFLELGDKRIYFRLEKARAKNMKDAALDDISLDIIRTVSEMGRNHRRRLEEQKSPLAKFLFFASIRGKCESPSAAVKKLSGAKETKQRHGSIFMYFPQLAAAGLGKGAITFSKIRNTEGVLEWFRKGSISAMARKLGNTTRVTLNHYIPKPLLAAWNARLIRRFQNLWISTAAANEDFLLEVTDFTSLTELHEFLLQMLAQHRPGSSPLATALHQAFGKKSDVSRSASKDSDSNPFLAVNISKQSLSALYLYQEACIAAGPTETGLDQVATSNKVTPRHFLDLAQLMRHRLPEHPDANVREAHEQAVHLAAELQKRLHWKDLFVRT